MKKTAHFASRSMDRWPSPREIERYFLAPPGQRWFFETMNDAAAFSAEWTDGSDHLRTFICFSLIGHPTRGLFLQWSKWNKRTGSTYYAKGAMGRLREFVITLHDDLVPVGLFVPYEQA